MRLYKYFLIFITIFFNTSEFKAQNENEIVKLLQLGTVEKKKEIVKIPIEIWNDLILLKLNINGKNATFLWDNGFSFSGIDTTLIKKYNLKEYYTDNKEIAKDGNNTDIILDFLICQKVDIKGISILNSPFIKIDLAKITQTKNLKIEGILGASIINKLNWRFNFDKNYVEISQIPFSIPSQSFKLNYDIIPTNNNHVMPISFNGNSTDCLIDFGFNSDNIEINKKNARFFSTSTATKSFGPSSISVSGISKIDTIYTIKNKFTWSISGKELNNTPKISFTSATNNIVIGNKFFRNYYNLTINTIGNKIYALLPRKEIIKTNFDLSYGYTLFLVDSKLKILKIDSNINTKDDIKLFDEVLTINGKTSKEFKDAYSLKKFQNDLLNKSKKIILDMKNSQKIALYPQEKTTFKFNDEKGLW